MSQLPPSYASIPIPNFSEGPIRAGFSVWRRKVQASVGMFPGRHCLAWRPEDGAEGEEEEIELQDLENPRPGTYKLMVELSLADGSKKWGTSLCEFRERTAPRTATELRDPTRVYSQLIETLEQRLGRAEKRNEDLESRLTAKQAALDEYQARVTELQRELEESKSSLIDEESATLILEVLDRYLNTSELRDLLVRLVDAAGADTTVRRRLLARVPDLLHAIGDVLGENDTTPDPQQGLN